MYDLRWGTVIIPIHGENKEVFVALSVDDDWNLGMCYWIRFGGLINAIYKPYHGKEIVGVGANRYAKEIIDAVIKFRFELSSNKFAFKYKEKGLLRVIESNKESDL